MKATTWPDGYAKLAHILGKAMKSLATLIKLQKTLVDEQRIQLAKLQARLDEIERRSP